MAATFATLTAVLATVRKAWDDASRSYDWDGCARLSSLYWDVHAQVLAVAPARAVTMPNGRIVVTNFLKDEDISNYDRVMDGWDYGWERYCEEMGKVAHPWMVNGYVQEAGAVPGSPYALALQFGDDVEDEEIALYRDECDRDARKAEAVADAEEAEMYRRLERPRKRRMRPVDECHRKRGGHRDAHWAGDLSDRLAREYGWDNYARYKPEAA